jgi:hypothetical protein
MRLTSVKEYERSLSGGEPTWNNKETSLTKALNWYNYHSDNGDSKKFTIQYLKELKEKKEVISILEKVPEQKFENLGFVCRMKLRGAPLTEKNNQWILNKIEKLMKELPAPVKKVDVQQPTISIQERVVDKSKEYIAEIDSRLDDFILNKNMKPFNMHDFMLKIGVKKAHTNTIKKFFEKRIAELNEVMTTKDAQLKEGYSNFSKKQLKDFVGILESIVVDSDKLAHNAKVIRKPRKKKAVTVEKLISKVQYKKTDDGLKINSITPSDILGSSQLLVYNAKTRKLGVYHAIDKSGFSIKGTTLLNFDEQTSVQKNLRKPDVIVPEVIKAGKVSLRKLFTAINSVEQPLTGRLNSDTILLRVIK